MEINYRLLDAGSDTDMAQWLDLYSVCFHEKMLHDYWDWLYNKNPFYKKTRPLIFVAETNQGIIGAQSAIPSRIQVNYNQESYLLNSCDLNAAMVHPEFQKQGISSALLKNVINLAKEEGYDLLTVCSTNLNAYQSLVHAGFTCVTGFKKSRGFLSLGGLIHQNLPFIPQRITRTIGFPLFRIIAHISPAIPHAFHVEYGDLRDFFGDISRIHAENLSDAGIFGDRTLPFLQWRFFPPGIRSKCLSLWDKERMCAYLILDYPDAGKNVLIEDLFVREDDEYLIPILVSEAVAILKKDNVDSIWTYLIDNNESHSEIFSLRNGFISHSSGLTTPVARFLFLPLTENPAHEVFSDAKQWNFQCADFWYFETDDY